MTTWFNRKPDFTIGTSDRPYLHRWFLIPKNRFLNAYLHCIMRDDDDRALHDHPWFNISIVLRGSYIEVMPDKSNFATPHLRVWDMPKVRKVRAPGSVVFRLPTSSHRLEVFDGPVWTLFITGPRVREWGFHCAWGWRHWKKFTSPENSGEIGMGCD